MAKTKDMKSRVAELLEKRTATRAGGGQKRIDKQHAAGKMTARERIDALIDPLASPGVVREQIVPDAQVLLGSTIDAKPAVDRSAAGSIEIALSGGVRVRIKGAVDPAAVTAAVDAVMKSRRRPTPRGRPRGDPGR